MMIATTPYASATTLATEATKRSDSRPAAAGTATATDTATQPKQAPVVVFNPRSRFDSEAGVFVMEFRSAKTGEIERRFPDEQQLKAYRQAAASKSQGAPGAGAGVVV